MNGDNDSVGARDIVGDGVVYDADSGGAVFPLLLELERGEEL